jgi:hypothetical protein
MTKPNPLCNLSGGQVLIKRNSKEIWREVFLKPRSMVVNSLYLGKIADKKENTSEFEYGYRNQ